MAYFTRPQIDAYFAADAIAPQGWDSVTNDEKSQFLQMASDRFDSLPWPPALDTADKRKADTRVKAAFYEYIRFLVERVGRGVQLTGETIDPNQLNIFVDLPANVASRLAALIPDTDPSVDAPEREKARPMIAGAMSTGTSTPAPTPGTGTGLTDAQAEELRKSVDIDAISISDDDLDFISHDGTATTINLEEAVEDNVHRWAWQRSTERIPPSYLPEPLHTTTTIVRDARLVVSDRNLAYAIPGASAVPANDSSTVLEFTIKAMNEPDVIASFNLSELYDKTPVVRANTAIGSTNALSITQGDDTHYIGRDTSGDWFFGSNSGDTYDVTILTHLANAGTGGGGVGPRGPEGPTGPRGP